MGKYTYLLSLPARHRVRINIGPSSYRRAPAAAIVRGNYTPQTGRDLEAAELTVIGSGKKTWPL